MYSVFTPPHYFLVPLDSPLHHLYYLHITTVTLVTPYFHLLHVTLGAIWRQEHELLGVLDLWSTASPYCTYIKLLLHLCHVISVSSIILHKRGEVCNHLLIPRQHQAQRRVINSCLKRRKPTTTAKSGKNPGCVFVKSSNTNKQIFTRYHEECG